MSQKRWVVGVDVGGTFTDLFVLDEQSGTARIVKVPSTRGEERSPWLYERHSENI
ncbi:MAG: Acetophenone carboxylase gamma subunit [Pseudomonadota bacterium]